MRRRRRPPRATTLRPALAWLGLAGQARPGLAWRGRSRASVAGRPVGEARPTRGESPRCAAPRCLVSSRRVAAPPPPPPPPPQRRGSRRTSERASCELRAASKLPAGPNPHGAPTGTGLGARAAGVSAGRRWRDRSLVARVCHWEPAASWPGHSRCFSPLLPPPLTPPPPPQTGPARPGHARPGRDEIEPCQQLSSTCAAPTDSAILISPDINISPTQPRPPAVRLPYVQSRGGPRPSGVVGLRPPAPAPKSLKSPSAHPRPRCDPVQPAHSRTLVLCPPPPASASLLLSVPRDPSQHPQSACPGSCSGRRHI